MKLIFLLFFICKTKDFLFQKEETTLVDKTLSFN